MASITIEPLLSAFSARKFVLFSNGCQLAPHTRFHTLRAWRSAALEFKIKEGRHDYVVVSYMILNAPSSIKLRNSRRLPSSTQGLNRYLSFCGNGCQNCKLQSPGHETRNDRLVRGTDWQSRQLFGLNCRWLYAASKAGVDLVPAIAQKSGQMGAVFYNKCVLPKRPFDFLQRKLSSPSDTGK